jgi:hypothetical protein
MRLDKTPIKLAQAAAFALLAVGVVRAQIVTASLNQNICGSPTPLTTASFSQAGTGAPAICTTTTQWTCNDGILGVAVVTLGTPSCPGVSLAGVLSPWIGSVVFGPTILLTEPLTDLGCTGSVESWQHVVTIPATSVFRTPGVSFNVQHVLWIANGSGPASWYGVDNAVEFTLTADSVPLIGWGVPPAHQYSNDGRSTGSDIRIPALAYRHVNDGDIDRVRFTLTLPNLTQQTQTVFARTTETPTASISGSPFVTSPSDQQSQLNAYFFTEDASQLADGLYRLQADVIASDGATVLASIADMSFWNNWGGTAITVVDRYVDFGAGADANDGLSPGTATKTIHGALRSYITSGANGVVATRSGTASAQFLRVRMRGSANQSWGGSPNWSPMYGTDDNTWLEIVGEGATADGNVLVQEPINQGNGAGGVKLGYNGVVWVRFHNVVIDGDWGLDYANGSMTDTRGWYDGVTMYPGVYGNPAQAPHVAAILFRQGLNGFIWNYGTNVTYQNVMDIDTFNVGSDIEVKGALMQSAGRFADSSQPYVHWGVQVPKQDSTRGFVQGTFEPFNSSDWPWNDYTNPTWAAYSNVTVTATAIATNTLRVSIPGTAPSAGQFLAAAQALLNLPDVGFKLRYSNATYSGYVSGANEGDWEVVGAGTISGNPYVDLDMGATTATSQTNVAINLKATYKTVNGFWDPNGFDPHPDILETYVSGRDSSSPPIIVQGFRAYNVANAQLVFSHGGDLVNTAFVNCAIGTPSNSPGVMNTGATFFRMRNFIFRNNYIPATWAIQFGAATFDYADVEVTNNILHDITGTVPGGSASITGHFHFLTNLLEGVSVPGAFGALISGTYTFTWSDPSRGASGDFTNTSSVSNLGPWGFALDGTNSGS